MSMRRGPKGKPVEISGVLYENQVEAAKSLGKSEGRIRQMIRYKQALNVPRDVYQKRRNQ